MFLEVYLFSRVVKITVFPPFLQTPGSESRSVWRFGTADMGVAAGNEAGSVIPDRLTSDILS